MTCLRCDGLLVSIEMEDFRTSNALSALKGWQCLLCGDITDAIIISAIGRALPQPRTRTSRACRAGRRTRPL